MSNLRTSKFVPLAKHAFDLPSIRKTQQAVNALLNSRMVQGSGAGNIHNADGDTIFELPAPPAEIYYPFQVYPVGTNAFKVHDGFIGCRSRYVEDFNGNILGSLWPTVEGNFEQQVWVPMDSGGLITFGQLPNQVLYNSTDTELADSNGVVGALTFSADTDEDDDGKILFSIWVEVNDGVGGLDLNLYARMWSFNPGATGRPTAPFPAARPGIIPIALTVSTDGGKSFEIDQIQAGDLINRYPGYVEADGFGAALNYRGDWTTEALSGQYFYPGDMVTNGTVVISGHTIKIQFIRRTYGTTAVAPADGADWRAMIT